MHSSSKHLELVRSALHAQEMMQSGCLVFNKASEELQAIGELALSAIEYVIREEVMSTRALDGSGQEEFPGLGNLIVTYFQIAKNGEMDRAARFLASVRGAVAAEAIRAIGVVWVKWTPKTGQSTKLLLAVQERGTHEAETEVPQCSVQGSGGLGGGQR